MSNPGRSRRLIAVGIFLVTLLTLTVAWGWVTGSDERSACPGDATLTTRLADGDLRLRPFAPASPWNQRIPLDQQPDLSDPTVDELTTAFRAGTTGGRPEELGSVHTWVNSESYSIPLFQADECDPSVRFDQDWESESLSGGPMRIPEEAVPAPGTDATLLVVQPDGRTLLEVFRARRINSTTWHSERVELVELDGTGMGPDNGIRAFGGSAYGGLIRKWEVDPTDPNYRDGVIDHGLAIAVPNSMLRFTDGDPGRDANGFGTSFGYVAPATEQDFDSKWAYRGIIPMGSKVVLPASVDVDGLGFGPAVRSIALALQRHGGFVADRSGDGVVTFYAEPGVPEAWLDGARGEDADVKELDVLRSLLVIVPPS